VGGDRGGDALDRLGLRRQQFARARAAAPLPDWPCRQWPAKAARDLCADQATSHEPGDGALSMPAGKLGRRQLAGRARDQVAERSAWR